MSLHTDTLCQIVAFKVETEITMTMITSKEFKKFELDLLRSEKQDIKKNFKIVESLYEEAVLLGIFPLKDPLDGFEIDIKIAKAVNGVHKIVKKSIP